VLNSFSHFAIRANLERLQVFIDSFVDTSESELHFYHLALYFRIDLEWSNQSTLQ